MLDWLYTAIASVMKFWHWVFSSFLDPAGGITWALSIVFLVVTIRVLLFRLFIRQVKSQRAMQEIQPEIQKLRKQYGADRQGFSQAVMALQKERGVNPLAGCLPILPQIPVFISLFHVLRRLRPEAQGLYGWSEALTQQASVAKLFGAPISSSLVMQEPKKSEILALDGVGQTNITVVSVILIVIMVVTSYYTQRQIMKRSGPVEGQAAMVQKFMLYGMPLGLLFSSGFFPIGVLLYWFTNNLWTLGQQFYILKKLPPPPGSPAALAQAAAEKAAIDPKALAPKPGAKPVRGKGGRPVTPSPAAPSAGDAPGNTAGDAAGKDGAGSTGTGSAGATSPTPPSGANGAPPGGTSPNGSTAPRPGARPAGKAKRKRR